MAKELNAGLQNVLLEVAICCQVSGRFSGVCPRDMLIQMYDLTPMDDGLLQDGLSPVKEHVSTGFS